MVFIIIEFGISSIWWNEFAQAHGLAIGWSLVFWYEGHRVFTIMEFGMSKSIFVGRICSWNKEESIENNALESITFVQIMYDVLFWWCTFVQIMYDVLCILVIVEKIVQIMGNDVGVLRL